MTTSSSDVKTCKAFLKDTDEKAEPIYAIGGVASDLDMEYGCMVPNPAGGEGKFVTEPCEDGKKAMTLEELEEAEGGL